MRLFTRWLVVVVVLSSAPAALAEPRNDPPKGGVISAEIVATWLCQDQLRPDVPITKRRSPVYHSPWSMKKHSLAFARAQYNGWRIRHRRCQSQLDRRKWEWNWQASVPYQGQRLAQCESSVNWYAEGSSRDGTFYSAFNIGRSRYDTAAHKMGVRGWHEGPGVPSPWEQWQAAIGYYRLYGDGWTGNCRGIMYA